MIPVDERRVLVVGGGDLSVERRRQIAEVLAARGGDEVAVVFSDNLSEIPRALARISEVTTREAEAAVKRFQRTVDRLTKPAAPAVLDAPGPVNNRAARRARQFGRALR